MKYFVRPWLFLHKCSMHWESYRLPKSLHTPIILLSSHLKKEGWKPEYQILQKMRVGLWTVFWSSPSSEIGWTWHNLSTVIQGSDSYLCVGLQKIFKFLLEIKGLMVFTFLICLNLPTFCAPCFWNYSPGVPWQCIFKLVFHLSVMCPVHPERISSPYAHFTLCLV